METVHNVLLFIHVTSGFVGLTSGRLASLMRKRRGAHSFLGWIFTYSMYGVAFTGLPLSLLRTNYFLMAISIFTLYMVLTGSRAFKPTLPKFHLRISIFGFAGAFTLLTLALMIFLDGRTTGLIPGIFGGLLLSMSRRDFRTYRGQVKTNPLLLHLNQMGGSLIAAYTAFATTSGVRLVNQLGFDASDYTLLFWLLPTAIGSLILTRVNMQVRRV